MTPTLKNYVDASNPLFFLRTTDYDRVSDVLIPKLFEDYQKPVTVFEWRPAIDNSVTFLDTVGGKISSSIPVHVKLKNTNNHTLGAWLANALTYDPKHLQKAPLVLLIYNPDLAASVMSETGQKENSLLYPMVAELSKKFRFGDSYIFMVGASGYIPADMEELVTFYDIPLPTQEELVAFFRQQLVSMKKNSDAPIRLPKGKEAVTRLLNDAANAALGLGYHGAEAALSLSLAMYSEIRIPVIYTQKAAKVANSDVLELIDSDETAETIAGFERYIEWLNLRKDVFSPEARKFGLPYPKGVLITGIAGTGKSTAAKMTANYLNLPLIRMDVGKLYRSLLGASEQALRHSLKTIEAISPAVIWIEEIEKVMVRGTGETDGGVSDRIMATLLHWRQETKAPVFFVATANDIESLPPALYRKERFDKIWGVKLPELETRVNIFKIHLKKFGKLENFKEDVLLTLGKASEGFSGAEIKACISDAMFLAWDKRQTLSFKHLAEALQHVHPLSLSRPDVLDDFLTWANKFSVDFV